jgi:hypothetical protein
VVTWTDPPPERPAPGTIPRSAWSRFMEAVGLVRQDAQNAVRKLPEHQSQALAARVELEDKLTRMAADLVPEDDPAYMEALAEYQALPEVEIPEGSAVALFVRNDAAPVAVVTEPEAN